MNKSNRLRETYNFIKQNFFPRWDRDGRWAVREVWDLPSDGRCDTKEKLIFVRPVSQLDDDNLHLLLIHEICHAFYANHGDKWCQRIHNAAVRARQIGLIRLWDMLLQEIEEYQSDRMATASEIYKRIQDAVHWYPDASYGDLMRYLAFEQGLYKMEFEKKYALCRKSYDKAVRKRRKSR
ncbi:MAG: hypothetical protein HN580_22425 [Deltaproteobacteria bacterium]|jgi:hypothetical protein|nr:hypothetical protein [Deltaproteobacteria bacterium]MBT4267530.1 hypothetical protein [Deltaproteobacteria bacterium]MBT4637804.1 hypothetical protein [Deltaproteobacteria bacterium]MBT6498740.1 hypothetical protein [Deltaproteobacteria bacterium]MBT6611725.1 hypothetical protein [Deltaproteobacteria bacterium]